MTIGGKKIVGYCDFAYKPDTSALVVVDGMRTFEILSPHISEITKLAERFTDVTATLKLSTQAVRRLNRLLRNIKKRRFCKQIKQRLPRKLKKQLKKMLK